MPFGQLPLLEIDGEKLTQSSAILGYIAKKHGLEGDDELATSWYDMIPQFTPAFKENDKEKQKQMFIQVIQDFVKPRLKVFNERIGEKKTQFLAGNKVTWCDFVTYNFLYITEGIMKVSFEPYPHLTKLMRQIENLPKIKQWQAEHPNVPYTLLPSSPME